MRSPRSSIAPLVENHALYMPWWRERAGELRRRGEIYYILEGTPVQITTATKYEPRAPGNRAARAYPDIAVPFASGAPLSGRSQSIRLLFSCAVLSMALREQIAQPRLSLFPRFSRRCEEIRGQLRR
jgi:hypothetical protein